MVLAIVVKNVEEGGFIINHVQNYPLGCTIPCTQSILSFSFTQGDIHEMKDNFSNANSAKNIKMNTLIGVSAVTLTSHHMRFFSSAHHHGTWIPPPPIDPLLEVDHLHLRPLRQKRRRHALFVSSMWFLDSWKMFYFPSQSQSCASQPPPLPHAFFSWILSIRPPILPNLCSKGGHTLWALPLL